jgi:hypothetical protein
MEEKKMRKMMMVLVAVLGLAGLVAIASAHMWDGGHPGRKGYDSGYGWNCGMGPGAMHSGMGPGYMHQSGYYCGGTAARTSARASSMNLLAQEEIQKSVEAFAKKSFPGYRVGKVERDGYGRPLYSASLTGNDSRFEVQVNAVDGRIIGVYPIEE